MATDTSNTQARDTQATSEQARTRDAETQLRETMANFIAMMLAGADAEDVRMHGKVR